MKNLFDTELDEETLVDEETKDENKLVLYNDDYNSFEHVIYCLRKYCGHTTQQAEQCALMIHEKGKYAIKHGDFKKLLPVKEALCDNGLSAEIE